MKTTTKLFAATVIAASLSAAGLALAHPGGGMGMGMGPGAGMGMMGMHQGGMHQGGMQGPQTPADATARLGELKSTLKITPDQEAAWSAYAAVVSRQAEVRTKMHESMQAQMQDPKANPQSRETQRESMQGLRQQHQAEQGDALKALYTKLTPEQKVLADQNLPGRQGGAMAGRMGGGMGGGMGPMPGPAMHGR